MNVALAIAACWPHLNCTAEVDAAFWTEAELYGWADEEAKRIARGGTAFVELYVTPMTPGEGRYPMPPRHLATVDAAVGTWSMRAASIEEIGAADRSWVTRQGSQPTHFAQDEQGMDYMRVYPAPTGAPSLSVLYVQHPTTLSGSTPTLVAPEVVRDVFMFAALAGARSKETAGAMPDVGEWCAGVTEVYRSVISQLWG